MKSRFLRFAALCLTGAFIGQGLAVGSCPASKLEKDLKATQKKIETEQKTIKKLKRESRDLLKALESADKEVSVAAKKCRVSETKIAELEKERRKTEKELSDLRDRIQERRKDQGCRLVAYYRLGKSGMLPLIFSDSSPPEKFKNLDSFKGILVADWQRIEAFHDLLEEKAQVEERLRERLAAQEAVQEKLRRRKEALEAKRQEKSALLFHIEQDQKLREQLLKELEEAARELKKKIDQQPPAPAIPEEGPLRAQKGKLPWPVRGKVSRKFNDPGVVRSKGIDIRTETGSAVRAVWRGSVVFADWFRGYGKLMIIHHGEKDYTVVAHLSGLTKRRGERVEIGEIVGHAGDTGSMDRCLVHFEIWHRGKADDPLKWLRKGSGGR